MTIVPDVADLSLIWTFTPSISQSCCFDGVDVRRAVRSPLVFRHRDRGGHGAAASLVRVGACGAVRAAATGAGAECSVAAAVGSGPAARQLGAAAGQRWPARVASTGCGLVIARAAASALRDAHVLRLDPAAEGRADRRSRARQGAGVAGGDLAGPQGELARLFEVEEAEHVAHGRAAHAELPGEFLDGALEVRDVLAEGFRLFEVVQVAAFEVFFEGELEGGLVDDVDDAARDVGQAGLLGGEPATFAGDELEAAVDGADEDRLAGCRVP